MKGIIKVSVILLLVSVTGLAGCEVKDANSQNAGIQQVKESLPTDTVLLVLPETADVLTKQQKEKTGRLVQIDSDQKQLIIDPGSGEVSIAFSDIAEVKLEGELKFHSNGQLVVRGDSSSSKFEEVWRDIPLSDFIYQSKNSEANEAVLKLTSFPEAKQEGIKTVASNSVVVVKEMKFSSNNTVTIKVTKQPL